MAAALAAAWAVAAPAGGAPPAGRAPGAHPPTRADLAEARRHVALLESELTLARARKPYIVVDALARSVRYALLGMTVREIAAQEIEFEGLLPPGDGAASGTPALAGIVTLERKENDPRLSPLTPEQIEAGAADENVADALPPEAPADYRLSFKQRVRLRVAGIPEKKTTLGRLSSWLRGLRGGGAGGGAEPSVEVTLHVDEGTAREIYRSLVPGERLVLVPPLGGHLGEIGQETPRSIKPARPRSLPQATQAANHGVPFRIPPPVSETSEEGAPPPPAVAAPGEAPPGAGPGGFSPASTPDPARGETAATPAEPPAPAPAQPTPGPAASPP